MSYSGPYYIGVDVGSYSVRAALFSANGALVNIATHPIKVFEPQIDFYEQSSDDIWLSTCKVVRSVTNSIDVNEVSGIGFDGTCSLVVLDKAYRPVSVSPTGETSCNVVMWMDHRAAEQAKQINKTEHQVLSTVGGVMSLEAQIPKLLWLKQKLHEQCWSRAGHFMELTDFLTWKCTGSLQRSTCSVVCKWTYYIPDAQKRVGWVRSFFEQIGLQDLLDDQYFKIGADIVSPGSECSGGAGLTDNVATELGLAPGTKVAAGLIDAYAGFLGCISCTPKGSGSEKYEDVPLTERGVLICGTSSCYLSMSQKPLFVPGVWGPYQSVVFPEYSVNEGGQSVTGKLLDHVITEHPAHGWVKHEAEKRNTHIHEVLNEILDYMQTRDQPGLDDVCMLSKDVHIWPDYHGNRSPLADPSLKGMISGLTLGKGAEDLAVLYLAFVQALAYGVRHIIDTMKAKGATLKLLYMCGGLSKNKLFVQTHADAVGIPVVVPDCSESVLLGSAMLGACASGNHGDLRGAADVLAGEGAIVMPDARNKRYHDKKYAVFMKMLKDQREYAEIMNR